MQDAAEEERLRSWSEHLVRITRLRVLKKRAADAEEYAEASRLKKQEHALLAELKQVEDAAVLDAGEGSSPGKRARLEKPRGREFRVAVLTRRAWRGAADLAGRQEEVSVLLAELKAWAPPGAFATDSEECIQEDVLASDSLPFAQKQEEVSVRSCPVPGMDVERFLSSSNEDLWQKAWETCWHKAEEAGTEDDERAVYLEARRLWKSWIQARDKTPAKASSAQRPPNEADTSRKIRSLQEQNWSKADATEWRRVQAELERRRKVREDCHAASSRDLCAIVKQLCPADQPLPFERLLAACPPKTTVGQLIQAICKEPQEFRQNVEGSEFCVRPVNSTCVDWLPVRSSTIPPGFREGACLSESVLRAAKKYFESKMRPAAQVVEDPLAHFVSQPGRMPHDTPLAFVDVLSKCPPGTGAADLVRSMSKRRDLFRQDSADDGESSFCVRPRVRCKDWGAVNPYMTPSLQSRSSCSAADVRRDPERRSCAGYQAASVVVGGPMRSADDYGEE